MIQERERAIELLKPLRQIQAGASEPTPARARRRQQVISALEDLVEAGPRAREQRHWVGLGMTGALAMVAGIALWLGREPPISVEVAVPPLQIAAVSGAVMIRQTSGAARLGTVGLGLAPRDEITLEPRSTAALHLAHGAEARLEGASQIVVGSGAALGNKTALSIRRGTATFAVPKLPPGEQFSVATPSATVVVVGTRFGVTVIPALRGKPARSCVGVSEGRVRVLDRRGSILLTPGQEWSSDGRPCQDDAGKAGPANAAGSGSPRMLEENQPGLDSAERDSKPPIQRDASAAPKPAASALLVHPASRHAEAPDSPALAPTDGDGPQDQGAAAGGSSGQSPTAAFVRSSLQEQNRLFAGAVAARQSGQPARASELLTTLLRRFPNSPLAPQAERELAKVRSGQEPDPNGVR